MKNSLQKGAVFTLLLLLFSLIIPTAAKAVDPERPPEQLDLGDESPRKETILDLIFGAEARLPTEKGILIIDAFEDLNNNGHQDDAEPLLSGEVSCTVDEISYSVPAFIPGLNYNSRYTIRCSSESYVIYSSAKDIFIERRGHVIEISLPCGKL